MKKNQKPKKTLRLQKSGTRMPASRCRISAIIPVPGNDNSITGARKEKSPPPAKKILGRLPRKRAIEAGRAGDMIPGHEWTNQCLLPTRDRTNSWRAITDPTEKTSPPPYHYRTLFPLKPSPRSSRAGERPPASTPKCFKKSWMRKDPELTTTG